MSPEYSVIKKADYNPVKPVNQIEREAVIRQELLADGCPAHIVAAVTGYTPEQVPYVYKTEPSVGINGGPEGGKVKTELWVGTTDSLPNIMDGEWKDQIPEVITQWWRWTPVDGAGKDRGIEREEIHHLPDGSFVSLKYRGVSEMGQFDGKLSGIALNEPSETFRPWGTMPVRQMYRIRYFQRRKDTGEWYLDESMRVSGTTILNGVEQMLGFHLGEIEAAKEDPSRAFRYRPLPEPKVHPQLEGKTAETQSVVTVEQNRLVEQLRGRAEAIMNYLTPKIIDSLVSQSNEGSMIGLIQMMKDGIFNHPEKIQVLDHTLAELNSEQRLDLAQALAREIKSGAFRSWVATLQQPENAGIVNDVIKLNTQHMLAWLAEHRTEATKAEEWVTKAERTMAARIKGQRVEVADEFMKCYDGMKTSLVERYVSYLAQIYLGNSLQ